MHQTIYIDSDEELTSILDKIRQEPVAEIFLVVPKGSILVSSIINLKLLKKEAERLGKKVVIVAPRDKKARLIIERAGLPVQEYQEQLATSASATTVAEQPLNQNNLVNQVAEQATREVTEGRTERFVLGSDSFFEKGRQEAGAIGFEGKTEPIKQTNGALSQQSYSSLQRASVEKETSRAVPSATEGSTGKKKWWWLGGLAAVFLVAILSFFHYFPKLHLKVIPLAQTVDQEVKFTAAEGAQVIDCEEKIIPGEYSEMTISEEKEFEATGSKIVDKNAQVARGKVTIYNYYSAQPQTLVRTTRILGKNSGKLFRLNRTVIVPGKKGDQPGTVEVEVYADKPGEEYNIGPEEFTIEGFKSKPEKYEKFKVKSETAMSGGLLSAKAQERKIVTKDDLNRARQEVLNILDKKIESEIKKRLNPGQVVLFDSIAKEVLDVKPSHLEGAVTDKFTYQISYLVKFIAFQKDDAEQLVKMTLKDELPDNYSLEKVSVKFLRGIADWDKKKLLVYSQAQGTAWFKLDPEEIKRKIAGKDLATLPQVLNGDQGINKAEIRIIPDWFKRIPKDLNKIEVEISQETENNQQEAQKDAS